MLMRDRVKRRRRADANAALPPPADRVSVIAPTPPDRAANDNHLPDDASVPASTLHEIVLDGRRPDRDPFCDAVLRHMGDDVLGALKPRQREALERALHACRPLQRHPVDVRGVIPIFFWRFYYVILMGRDRRVATDALEADRRRKANFIADVSG